MFGVLSVYIYKAYNRPHLTTKFRVLAELSAVSNSCLNNKYWISCFSFLAESMKDSNIIIALFFVCLFLLFFANKTKQKQNEVAPPGRGPAPHGSMQM